MNILNLDCFYSLFLAIKLIIFTRPGYKYLNKVVSCLKLEISTVKYSTNPLFAWINLIVLQYVSSIEDNMED